MYRPATSQSKQFTQMSGLWKLQFFPHREQPLYRDDAVWVGPGQVAGIHLVQTLKQAAKCRQLNEPASAWFNMQLAPVPDDLSLADGRDHLRQEERG